MLDEHITLDFFSERGSLCSFKGGGFLCEISTVFIVALSAKLSLEQGLSSREGIKASCRELLK